MAIPTVTIRRVSHTLPNGSEVLINGHRIEGVEAFSWQVEAGDIDHVVLQIKAKVIVEYFDAPQTTEASITT